LMHWTLDFGFGVTCVRFCRHQRSWFDADGFALVDP